MPHRSHNLTPLMACLALMSSGTVAWAQTPAGASRITQVTVYPGLATVERVARVPAQARSLTLTCLPASLDVSSLQVQADAGVRVGEFSVLTEDRDPASACGSPLDGRIRELQDQIAALQAELSSQQLVDAYLKDVAHGAAPEGASGRPQPATASQITSTAEALRKASAESLARANQLKRRQEALEQQLKPLVSERDRVANQNTRVVSVTVNLAAEREGDVRLSYQVRGPSWQPGYRASLDTVQGGVQLERLALVAQATGEDWSNVALTLSTGQPGRNTHPPQPRPWTLDIAPPVRATPPAAPAPALAMAAPMAKANLVAEAPTSFEVSTLQKGFSTEFVVPQRVSVATNGQRITLSLGQQRSAATLLTRTTPQQEEAAYLVARLPRPEGVWPAGAISLYRDGAYIGAGRLDFDAASSDAPGAPPALELAFGRDELVRVRAEPAQELTGSIGLTGSRTERKVRRSYAVENRHRTPITLQVLHASPTSRNEKIEVESSYQPQPTDLRWQAREGAVAWQQTLAAGASARFSAEHTLRYPKDIELQERR